MISVGPGPSADLLVSDGRPLGWSHPHSSSGDETASRQRGRHFAVGQEWVL